MTKGILQNDSGDSLVEKKGTNPWLELFWLFLPPINMLGVPFHGIRFLLSDLKALRRGIDEEARRFASQRMVLLFFAGLLLVVEMTLAGLALRQVSQAGRRDLFSSRAQQVCQKIETSGWCLKNIGPIPTKHRLNPDFPFEKNVTYVYLPPDPQSHMGQVLVSSEAGGPLVEPIWVDCPCEGPN